MPELSNTKHERFAHGIAHGKPARKAYLDAGYNCKPSSADAAATALRKVPDVAARIEELKAVLLAQSQEIEPERPLITKKWLEDRVQDLAAQAEKLGNLSVARSCYELLGRDRGVFQERKTLTVRSLDQMSNEEIEDMLAELGARNAGTADSGRPN